MKIDLMKFVEDIQEIKDLRNKAKRRTEINNIIADIIKGEENSSSDDKELLVDIGIKFKERESHCFGNGFSFNLDRGRYKFKLNKENIKKIQKYIDNWEEV